MSRRFGEEGRELSYGTYLKVPELLQLQHGLSHEHDELLFIVAHQVYELWFKVVLFELEAARDRIDADDLFFARHHLHRVHIIEKLLVEQRTNLPLELQLSELVREKALQLTREEVPHSLMVEVDELADRIVRANVLVETASQKQILVGKGGSMIKEIGTRARPEIEALLGHTVFLELQVKVRPRWRRDDTTLTRLGI